MELQIRAINSAGQGIGRGDDGRVVFCPSVLPGETVRAEPVLQKKQYIQAVAKEILVSHPQRIEPFCPWFTRCGGCQLQHASYELQLQLKASVVRDALTRIGHFEIPESLVCHPSPRQWHYRNKASFPVRRVSGRSTVGFFRSGSHQIVPVDHCPLLIPSASKLYTVFRELILDEQFSCYDEVKKKGWLRHLVIRCSDDGTQMLLVLVVTQDPDDKVIESLQSLWEYLKTQVPELTGLAVNMNNSSGNVILTSQTRVIAGEEKILQSMKNGTLTYDATSFFQVNVPQAEHIFEKAAAWASGEQVLELFCGVGAITLPLARKAAQLAAVELWEPAVQQARQNMERNGLNTTILLNAAEDLSSKIFKNQHCVVVDPPRSGCDAALISTLIQSPVKRVIYVSCNPATLARDGARLRDEGKFHLVPESLEAFDMFPQTSHVETLAIFDR